MVLSFLPLIALVAISTFPVASAHGFVSGVSVSGKHYPAADPSWHLLGKTPSVVWYSDNYGQQNPIFSKDVSTDIMACHINATSGSEVIPVKPGDTILVRWSTPEGGPWRPSHEGPVIDYMAACGSDCRNASAADLKFFKIAEAGMYQSPHKSPGRPGSFGRWATDTLRGTSSIIKPTILLTQF
jgi:hypothetical protein